MWPLSLTALHILTLNEMQGKAMIPCAAHLTDQPDSTTSDRAAAAAAAAATSPEASCH